MWKTISKTLFGDPNEKKIRELKPLVEEINSLEGRFQAFSDEELQGMTAHLKERYQNGEDLEDLLPEAFATVREASRRTLGLRHYDVQLIGGMVLHQGRISEMRTGEGKTLVATLPAYLNALTGKGVHVVTVNDYLAKRDSEWMGKLYNFLGLTVGLIQSSTPISQRQASYAADITYGTNNEFGFDYLRDNMATSFDSLVQRPLHYAIIDEVDSILIDEARTPLIISGQIQQEVKTYYQLAKVADRLEKEKDFTVDEKTKNAIMTEEGIERAEKLLGLSDDLFGPNHVDLAHDLINAVKAKELYIRDKDYVVMEDQVIIVDEFTGRLMNGRRYSDGLHQAIEAKENVKIQEETQTLATITFQNYFRLYEKISGMTGTAVTEEEEFVKIYGLEVTVVPTNRTMVRNDQPDLIFKTGQAKFRNIVKDIEERHKKGQPVLVGTISIELSEYLSGLLKEKKVPHQVLNAKYHEKEAEIVAQAGRKGAVTIATNMAGRGTDILLGGNAEFLAKDLLKKQGLDPNTVSKEEWEQALSKIAPQIEAERQEVKAQGGLYILGTERHESRRIDNQLRGRAGRQGDPGESRFYLGLDDTLMRIFGGERIARIMDTLKVEEDMAIESGMVSRAVENAQKKVEAHHFGMRQQVLEYDDVMNKQREVIYAERRKVLEQEDIKDEVLNMVESLIEETLAAYANPDEPHHHWDLESVLDTLRQEIPQFEAIEVKDLENKSYDGILDYLIEESHQYYQAREEAIGADMLRQLERFITLSTVDRKWIDHLHAMDFLRDGIGLRALGQKNPLIEYKNEGYLLFQELMNSIRQEVVRLIYRVEVEKQVAMEEPLESARNVRTNKEEVESPLGPKKREMEKVGRNDPCPCGSGKKYKKCHGAAA